MQDFSTARKGDKVYDLYYGEGEIIEVHKASDYPIYVEFYRDKITPAYAEYSLNGALDKDGSTNPTLFWAKPQIIDNGKPPKRLVEKTGWINLYRAESTVVQGCCGLKGDHIFTNELVARSYKSIPNYVRTIKITYQVEE